MAAAVRWGYLLFTNFSEEPPNRVNFNDQNGS